MNTRSRQFARRGATAAVVALNMTVIMGMAALALDTARLYLAKNELQVSADAAALAGTGVLLDNGRLQGTAPLEGVLNLAHATAAQYGLANKVLKVGPVVDENLGNGSTGEIVVGYLADPTDRTTPLDFSNPKRFNAVQITVHRDETRNGSIALTFARIFGFQSKGLSSTATAMVPMGVNGYRIHDGQANAQLMPFALKDTKWAQLLASGANGSNDHYTYDPDTGHVTNGSDGIPELNLYPGAGIDQLPPGNFGTVDIGSPNNSTADISRQIRYGVNQSDLEYFGGELVLGPDDTLLLNGDTGLSAAVKDDLEAIKGQPRAIPLFTTVSGNGNNSYYVIDGFAGIRVMYVKLTGAMSGKKVMIQPAVVTDPTASTNGNTGSYFVFRPPTLCR